MKRQILLLLWLVVGGIVVTHADTNTVMPLDVKLFKAGRIVAEPTVDSIVVWEKPEPPAPPQIIPGKNLLVLADTKVYLNDVEQELTAPGIERCHFTKATIDEAGNVYILGIVGWRYTDDNNETHNMLSNLVWKNFEFDAEYVFEYTGEIHVNSFCVTGEDRYMVFELGVYNGNEFQIQLSPVIARNDEILTVGADKTLAFSSWKCVDGELRGAASALFDTDYHSTDDYFNYAMVCSEVKTDGSVTPFTGPDLSKHDIVTGIAAHNGEFLPLGSVRWCSTETDPYFASIFNTGGGWWNYEFMGSPYSYVYGLDYLSDNRRVLLVYNDDLERMQVLVDGWQPLYTLDLPAADAEQVSAAPKRAAADRAGGGYKMIVDGDDVYATSFIPSASSGKTMAGVWKNGSLVFHAWLPVINDILLY